MAERLTVAQDVVGSIPTRRPKFSTDRSGQQPFPRVQSLRDPTKSRKFRLNATHPVLPEWFTRFEPRRGLANGHLQTIVGNFLPRPAFRLAADGGDG